MSTWKVILATLIIFTAGLVTGGVLVKYTKLRPRPREPVFMRTEMLRRLTRELDLNEQQRSKVDALLQENNERTKILREILEPDLRAEYKKTVEEIRTQLTAEQRTKFDNLLVKQRSRKGGTGPDKKRGQPASNGVPVATNI